MQTRRRQCREVRGSGPLAFGLSLLLLGLQLFGLAHLALEHHSVCWEHGTVTELGSTGGAASGVTPGGVLPGLDGHPAAARLDADGHHHCPVQASRRDWGAPPAGAVLLLAAHAGPEGGAIGASAPRADDALLRRAPKQSPPPRA